MPDGKTHAAITITAALGWGIVSDVIMAYPRPVTVALCAGCLAGLILTPDLDVDETPTRAHTTVRRSLGWLPALAWRLIWLPYGMLIRHRSFISHAPYVGTTVRVLYLAALAWFASQFTGHESLVKGFVLSPPWWWYWAFSGLAYSDLLHWAADYWPDFS